MIQINDLSKHVKAANDDFAAPRRLQDKASDRRLALETRKLVKRFGDNVVLHGIDLTLHEGEILAVMGANGAGKSTLVQILSGVHQMDGGSLLIDGHEQRLPSPASAQAAGIVCVHQVVANTGVTSLSIAENLLFDALCSAKTPFFTNPRSVQRQARRVVQESGLELDLDLAAPFDSLGLAERQLVAIARAVSGATRILILDEPTASLSAKESARLFTMLERRRSRGIAILYISHRLADLERLADRVVVIRHGRIVGQYQQPLDLVAATLAMMGREREHTGALGVSQREIATRTARTDAIPGPIVASLSNVVLKTKTGTGTVHRQQRRAYDTSVPQTAEPINIDLHGGEITVVTGSLGAGKSRLLETLFGLQQAAYGSVSLAGHTGYPRSPAEAIRAGVFLVGEDRWRTSLADPSVLGADIAGTIALPHLSRWSRRFGLVNTPRLLREAAAAIRQLGIVCRGPGDRLDNLSGGNQQKVVVARWLAQPSSLLLLDEPFQGVDLGARRDLIAALAALGPQTAVLIATNDMEEALEAADRLLVMRERTIIADHRVGVDKLDGLLSRIAELEKQSFGVPA